MEIITHKKHGANMSDVERMLSAISGGALAAWGLARRDAGGIAMAIIGGELVRRGLTGRCYGYELLGISTKGRGQGAETTSVPYEHGIRVDESVTVNRPREEVYNFWRQLENLPRFMKHVQSVRMLDNNRSHWCATGPAGRQVEWDAEIHNEVPNELIAWRSLPGSQVDNAGSVHFEDAPGGRGTRVHVVLQYNPPAGLLGALAAKLWGEEPSQQIKEDLRRFKQILEAGETPTTAGQPTGRGEARDGSSDRKVADASEESFPASDAPAWSGVSGG